MKSVFLILGLMSSQLTFASETNFCYKIDVPPLLDIGNAPAEEIVVQISQENDFSQLKLLKKTPYAGLAMYASMCKESRGNFLCEEPFMGKGVVEVLKVEQTLSMTQVEMNLEKSEISRKLLGSPKNLPLQEISCDVLNDILN